jgi:ABC-type multidrug transport system ATPase subunit
VRAGEVFGLLGPNGAGKTTTLRMLATLTRPTSGTASIGGVDVVRDPLGARERLGYLSTSAGLPARLTCRECLVAFADLRGLAEPRAAADEALERFGVASFADRFVEGLSTGMRQRLRIACAAVHRPPVLILDEPTSGLDVVAADSLMSVIEDLKHEGAAVIFSTHVLPEAERLCDRIAVIYEGSILAVDTPDNLIRLTRAPDLRGAFLRVIAGR